MRIAFLLWCLLGLLLGGCGLFAGSGPTASEVEKQARNDHDIVFDVVKVDDRVLAAVLARPQPRFAARFPPAPPPRLRIAVGDRLAVVIWESGMGGLFTESPSEFAVPGLETEPLTIPPNQPGGAAQPPTTPPGQPGGLVQPPKNPDQDAGLTASDVAQAAEQQAGRGVRIPDQYVAFDGAVSVPYAGRVPAAGRTPQQVAATIEQRLAGKALLPQVLVLVLESEANSVTVGGEVLHSARIPLTAGGERLLQAIAAAGGARGPTHDLIVRLSRDGVTAAIPLTRLVDDPKEDIYAQPGDVLTLERVPKTFAVFGGTAVNRMLDFDAPHVALAEALARVHGLNDDRANPRGVFVFRYEPLEMVRALQMPPATHAAGGVSPIVYRFDWMDPKAYLLAGRFPLHDKDVIFVADAELRGLYQFVGAFTNVVGPVESGLLTCYSSKC